MNGIESSSAPIIRLKDGLDLETLLAGKPTTFEVNFEDIIEEQEETFYKSDEISSYLEDLHVEDEDVFQAGQSFEGIEKKSVNLTEDGKIKKRILREGYGEPIPDLSSVTIHYNAYVEFADEPFDSTYARKRPMTFRLNNGEVILGLDVAVKTMKINEKSQFLVHCDYAYGKRGCLKRIPPEATILYEIELKKYVDSGAVVAYETLNKTSQEKFEEIYKLSNAITIKGNELFSKKSYKAAVREYNIAVTKLETCTIPDYEHQIKQQELLLRLYSNLVVTYTKMEEPRKACSKANTIFQMCKGTSLKVPAKVFFNTARCLIMLSDYEGALHRLREAQKIEPQNTDIWKEFKRLEQLKTEHLKREVALSKAVFNYNRNPNENVNENVSDHFKQSFNSFCENFKKSDGVLQVGLPDSLTEDEISYAKKEAVNFNFEFINKDGKLYLIKTSE